MSLTLYLYPKPILHNSCGIHIDFQNVKPLQKSKNKPFLAIANLADSHIKAWLSSNNLSMGLRGPWAYIYIPKVNVETSYGMYIDFQNINTLQKSNNNSL